MVESLTETRRFEGVPVTVAQGWSTNLQAVDVILEGPIAELQQLQNSDLTAIVRVPPETVRREITVRHDPNAAARLDIMHPGSDELVVQDIKPSRLRVSRGCGCANAPVQPPGPPRVSAWLESSSW